MSSSTTIEVVDALPTTNTTPNASSFYLPEKSTAHLSPNQTSTSIPHESDPYTPPTPSLRLLFSLLSRSDLYLILLPAFILSIVAGAVAPFMTLVLGNVFETFAKFASIPSPSSDDRAHLKHDIAISALELVALAASALALSSLTSFLWILTGERNSLMIRQKVYSSVSTRDMSWFDTKMGSEDGAQTDGDNNTGAGGLMAKFARRVVVTWTMDLVSNSRFALVRQKEFAWHLRSRVVSLSSIPPPALPASSLVSSVRGLLLSSFSPSSQSS